MSEDERRGTEQRIEQTRPWLRRKVLIDQLDAILHFDQTRAVEPLERTALRKAGEVEERLLTGL